MKIPLASALALLFQLSFVFAASPIALPGSIEASIPPQSTNVTVPIDSSTSDPLSGRRLPPAPYDYQVTRSNMVIRFQDYRGSLPGGNVALCLLQAANIVTMNFGSRQSIGDAITTRMGRVRLKVIPTPRNDLTWELWGTAIRGLTSFVMIYEYRDMDFYIMVNGQIIGGGLISDQ